MAARVQVIKNGVDQDKYVGTTVAPPMCRSACQAGAGAVRGGERPAPGGLATVQALVNSHYDFANGGGELLANPEALQRWLARRGLVDNKVPLQNTDLERALAVREGLRALAWVSNGRPLDGTAAHAMRQASAGASTQIRIETHGPEFAPPRTGDVAGALGALLAMTAVAMLENRWILFKTCLGRDCGWAFYDRSLNRSARWGAMKICGDREKARVYYRRRIATDARATRS